MFIFSVSLRLLKDKLLITIPRKLVYSHEDQDAPNTSGLKDSQSSHSTGHYVQAKVHF